MSFKEDLQSVVGPYSVSFMMVSSGRAYADAAVVPAFSNYMYSCITIWSLTSVAIKDPMFLFRTFGGKSHSERRRLSFIEAVQGKVGPCGLLSSLSG